MSNERCDTCEYRERAYKYREQCGITIRLREELAKALDLSADVWGDKALEEALQAVARMKARAARWKAAAKRIRKREGAQ